MHTAEITKHFSLANTTVETGKNNFIGVKKLGFLAEIHVQTIKCGERD